MTNKRYKINLAKALSKNRNCLGYLLQFNNGTYAYQNDNDLGLDLEGLDVVVECQKIYLYKRFYAYLIEDDIEDDGTGVNFGLAKALLKECHQHFIPLTQEELNMCNNYWKSF